MLNSRANRSMSLDDVRRVAPSVFAAAPWSEVSDKYRYISTADILARLLDDGYTIRDARQGNTRIPGKGDFTRHQLRLRAPGQLVQAVGDTVGEIVLTNSHDRTSQLVAEAGIFRLACLNGMICAAGNLESVKVRHTGTLGRIIDGVAEVVEEVPRALEQVREWSDIRLTDEQARAYAAAAVELAPSTLEVNPDRLLTVRRTEDRAPDLYTTFNRVQENVIRGGITGRNANGRRMRTRAVTGIDSDNKFNRALWRLTEEMARLVV